MGENPIHRDSVGTTPLEYQINGCKSGEKIYQLLILFDEYKINFHDELTLLPMICNLKVPNRGRAVKFLLEKGLLDTIDKSLIKIVMNRVPPKNDDIIGVFLDYGVSLSEITNSQYRFFAACKFGKTEEILNWPGELPIDFKSHLSNRNFYWWEQTNPTIAAIENGHIEIVEFLIKKFGLLCLHARISNYSNCEKAIEAAVGLKDPEMRRKMVRLIIDALITPTISVLRQLRKLILCGDIELYETILRNFGICQFHNIMSDESEEIVVTALAASKNGHLDILKKVSNFIPESAWKSYSPLHISRGCRQCI